MVRGGAPGADREGVAAPLLCNETWEQSSQTPPFCIEILLLKCFTMTFSYLLSSMSSRGGHLGANEPTVALKCCCFFGSEEAPFYF